MTTIDFYLANENTLSEVYPLVCKLVDKAYQQKYSVYLHVNTEEEAKILDDLLWIFRDDAFIPHSLYQESNANIQIGFNITPENFNDILINLTPDVPPFFTNFQRALEIVPKELKEKARQKYRYYRDLDYDLTTYDLTKDSK